MDEGLTSFIEDGRTYLPVRYALEGLGVDVDWNGDTNTILIKSLQASMTEITYFTNFPTVPNVLHLTGLDASRIAIIEDTQDLLVYHFNFSGIENDSIWFDIKLMLTDMDFVDAGGRFSETNDQIRAIVDRVVGTRTEGTATTGAGYQIDLNIRDNVWVHYLHNFHFGLDNPLSDEFLIIMRK